MGLSNALLVADVAHARQRPKKNRFHYRVYYLAFALRDMPKLASRLFSVNRPNLFSFYEKDHGDGQQPVAQWAQSILREWDIPQADGDVVLMVLPRLFGYAFNPVSFWFCLDKEGALRAVISEVKNTFGDRHCYLSFHDDRRPITPDDWLRAEKIFHVSPFITREGYYLFRFFYSEGKIGVWINHHTEEGLLLTTSVVGKRSELTSWALLSCFLRYPMVTFKVIGLIHYQALKLFLKGVRYHRRPEPPTTEVSR